MTSERVGVTVTPDRLPLPPEGTATVSIVVENRGPVVDHFTLSVEGLEPSWYTLRPAAVNLLPGGAEQVALDVHAPRAETVPAGERRVWLTVASRDAPAEASAASLTLDVLSTGALQMALVPRRVTIGRGKGQFRIELTSTSNAAVDVDLAVADPEGALESQLSRDRLSLAAGTTEHVALVTRPRRRPLIAPPRTYPFSVTATPPQQGSEMAVDAIATAPGELIYRAPLAALAGVPPRARAAALALAALAVALALLIWFLAQPGRSRPFTEPPVAATPATAPAVAGAVAGAGGAAVGGPAAGGAGPGAAGAGAGAPPRIATFELRTPPSDGGSAHYALAWQVQDATEVKISGTPQPNPSSGTLPLTTLDDAEYVLEASNPNGKTTKTIGLVVLRPPQVTSLTASPDSVGPGQSATLSWKTQRGQRATLNGNAVDPNGAQQVQPTQDTTYTLVVENELGRAERSVQVRAQP